MELKPVEGYDRMAKDCHSGAVLNLDNSGLAAARAAKEKARTAALKMQEFESRLDGMESKLDQILALLSNRGVS